MRDRVAIGFAVILVVAVAAGGGWFLLLRDTGPTRQEQAEQLVDAYLDAWASSGWEDMAELVLDPPPDFAALHRDTWERLGVAGATLEHGPVTLDRGRADADVEVTLTLGDLGDWSYGTHLRLLRDDDRWRLSWSPSVLHPDLTESTRLDRRITEEPERAPILAHDGTPITGEQEVWVAGVHPARIRDQADVVRAFTEYAGVSEDDIRSLLEDDLNPEWFYPVATIRPEEYERVGDLLRPFPGIVFQRETRRLLPTEHFAAHVVGRTGEITAELLERLGPGYQPGDEVGLTGLERVFEDRLTGSAAGEVVLTEIPGSDGEATAAADGDEDDARPEVREVLATFGGEEPTPVTTTLDIPTQQAVEDAIAEVPQPVGVVVLDAGTGAVRAAASRPLSEEFNRALDGRYPPGSTFKIVTAAAVIAASGPDATTTCPDEVRVGGRIFRNAHELAIGGEVGLAEAFARSCNTAFVQFAGDLEEDDLRSTADSFGFGAGYELSLPTSGGVYTEPDDVAERAAAAIGQGRVEASPLHMASVAAAVASGRWRAPSLLEGDVAGGADPLPDVVVGPLRTLMRRVVTDGTGTAAEVPGEPVHGKTGSAEFGTERDASGDLSTHAWFVGYRGDLAFAVVVEGAGAGGDVAAPIVARLLAALS